MRYFLGADVGATKTQVLIADEMGRAVGFGQSGPGNHEVVGYDGFRQALSLAAERALSMAQLTGAQIAGGGFGVAGLDWPDQYEPVLNVVSRLGLAGPLAAVNDTLIGLVAGAEEGWGVAVVAGTGCNCRGWDRTRQRQGQVTGGGLALGEAAGGSEVVARAVQGVAHAWTGRGPATELVAAFIERTQARDLPDLLHGLMEGRLVLDASDAPLVFEVAARGDQVACEVIRWAGSELGEMANTVIRQLHFEALSFDVVLEVPPVVGAVLLGLEQAGLAATPAWRETLARTTDELARR